MTQRLSNKLFLFGGEPTIWCPACKEIHRFSVSKPNSLGAQWAWDSNVDEPTFSPSLRISVGDEDELLCHLTLTKGVIQFHSDCPHEMVGQKVELPDLPQDIAA